MLMVTIVYCCTLVQIFERLIPGIQHTPPPAEYQHQALFISRYMTEGIPTSAVLHATEYGLLVDI